jgi:hypothetical protein
MNKRWIIPTFVLIGLGLLGWWIASKTYWGEVSVPTPRRGAAVKNPFYAAQQFANALDATTEWRQSLGTPLEKDSVIVLTKWHWSLIEHRRKQLEAWVNNGGRLVIDHTLIGGESEFKEWSGLEISYPKEDAEEDEDTEEDADKNVDEEQPAKKTKKPESFYFGAGLCGAFLASYSPKGSDLRDRYTVCRLPAKSWISSSRPVFWALHDSQGMQAARIEIGKGSVTLLNAAPFGNRDLTQVDHGLLFVAITQLKHGDHVVFLSEEQHPGLLTLIWDNGKPVVLLAALLILLSLWRGAVRFGPLIAPTETARRSLAEQIRGTGLFILRFGGSQTLHAAMLRAVDDAARRRIINYSQLSSSDRVSALAHAAGVDADKLAIAIHHHGNRNTHDLQHAIALLETVRRALLPRSK